MKVLSVFGTRPEAIKMAPVVKALARAPGIEARVCVTGQHREMLDQVLNLFDITPDHDLKLMVADQTLNGLTGRILAALDRVLEAEAPDWILVHGDTTTSMAASIAAFHRRVKIGHVEAGLRTQDLSRPWPEEMNRRVTDAVADLLFPPTLGAKINLEAENLGSRRMHVTGNTVIDALLEVVDKLDRDSRLNDAIKKSLPELSQQRKILLVTGHRRENFGDGFRNICAALADLSERPDIEIVYPVHLNPNVRTPVLELLSSRERVHLISPLDYLPFVWLMRRAHVILTDSGGVQEEAPGLGKPVLVMRDVTERPEAVDAGTVQLVGTSAHMIVEAVNNLYDDHSAYERFAKAVNPYGDGRAAERIVAALTGRASDEFVAPKASVCPLKGSASS